ncbi:hypothetical protein M3Y94_01291800 [Aphelenchoides besseyi]|nr:hypothetical protein M3Y94_01291800 [Aphelenchoides besseyi]
MNLKWTIFFACGLAMSFADTCFTEEGSKVKMPGTCTQTAKLSVRLPLTVMFTYNKMNGESFEEGYVCRLRSLILFRFDLQFGSCKVSITLHRAFSAAQFKVKTSSLNLPITASVENSNVNFTEDESKKFREERLWFCWITRRQNGSWNQGYKSR